MDIDEQALLRDLRQALDTAAPAGRAAQEAALRAVLARHHATVDDVLRAVARFRARQAGELRGLADRLARVADQRAEEAATADAVDAFLRSLGRGEHPG